MNDKHLPALQVDDSYGLQVSYFLIQPALHLQFLHLSYPLHVGHG